MDTIVDEITYASSMGAEGDGNSLQKVNGELTPGEPTPGADNTDEPITQDTSSNDDNDNDENQSTSNHGDNERHKQDKEVTTKEQKNDDDGIDTYQIETYVDPVVVAGVPARIEIVVKKNGVRRLKGMHHWSFGDGRTYVTNEYPDRSEFRRDHTYHEPGIYTLVFEYSSSMLQQDPDVVHTMTIEVTSPDIAISDIEPGGYIELENTTGQPINLEKWQLYIGGENFVISRNTLIQPNSTLRLADEVIDIPIVSQAILRHPNGDVRDVYVPQQQKPAYSARTSTASVYNANNASTTSSGPAQKSQAQPIENERIETPDKVVIDSPTKESSDSLIWYVIGLAVVCIGGLAGMGYLLYERHIKKSDSNDYPIDDIEIIED